MKKASVILACVLGMAFWNSAAAVEMGIITGKEKGTYYQFGLNLQQLMQQHGFEVNVIPSDGSIENIYAVYKRPGVPLGIVQSDVLAFVAKLQTNQLLKNVAKKIKMVYPLYNEEIHLVGRQGIASFDDLANKRVAIGEEGSGTYLTSKLLFEVSKVSPKEMVLVGTDQALAKLKAGAIDAMVYVAGLPVKLFSENISETDNLKIIPITNKDVQQFYPVAEIPAGTYAWQQEAVPTVAVKAVLISFDFRTANCENVGRFAGILAENLGWLQQNGHPKWKAVDLSYSLKGWEQYDCVAKYAPPRQKPKPKDPSQLNPVLDAIREILE
ncbi:MAG: TAXI family TRAP transporter solute-binding subunit [Syntrophobacteraceae bacterium]|nr:TAXI family TRAP transporter solute-binding subunit [Syntrophobacteraceae bacterium]